MSGDWLALGAIAALAAVATGRRGSANERAWLPLDLVSAIEPEMARQGVSKVARSKRGFLTAFKRAGGKPDKLGLTHPDTPNRDPYPWRDRRNEFVSRHMGQVKANNEPLWRDGRPTRRHLGLVAWAYSPNPTKLREWIKGSLSRRGSHSAVAKRSVYTQDDGWKTEPAHTTKDHAFENDTLIAKWMARMEGEPLGQGNFGVTHLVQTIDGPRVVKVPASHSIHGTPWDLAELRRWFVHEAGVANELTNLGYRIVPRTTFVDKPIDRLLGLFMEREPIPFALVREYGDLVTSMTPAEFSKLERDLFDLENVSGWYPADDLLVLRRPDGSLFIGDVGIWSAPTKGGRKQSIGWDSNMSHLTPSLAHQVVSEEAGRAPSMAGMLYQVQRLAEKDFEDEDDGIWKQIWLDHIEDLREDVEKRRAVGLAIPVEVQSLLTQHAPRPDLGRNARKKK